MTRREAIPIIVGVGIGVAILLIFLFGPLKSSYQDSPFGNYIALIEVKGEIKKSEDIVKQLKRYSKDSRVRGILLRIDSPGGRVSASQEIYSELKRIKRKKKIAVSMGGLATSGGYYISLPADIIVANPGTITGSIGVIMSFPIVEKLFKKWGIEVEAIKSREHKDIGSPFRPITEEERRLLSEVIGDVYDQFVEAVVENRNLPKEKVLKIADGRIFSGRQAKRLGLIDTLGSFEDAIRILAKEVGIKGEPKIIKKRRRISLFRRLLEGIEDYLIPKLKYSIY